MNLTMDKRKLCILRNAFMSIFLSFVLYLTFSSRKANNFGINQHTEPDILTKKEGKKENIQRKMAIFENEQRVSKMNTRCEALYRMFNSTQYPNSPPYTITQYPFTPLLSPPEVEMLKLDKSHKISICVPFKAGSETWRYLLSSTSSNGSSNIEISKIQSIEAVSDYSKAIQVRDPYERLLSAYRFTFEHGTSLKNSNNLNSRLLDKYSFLPSDLDESGKPVVSFPQFIQSIVSGYRDFSSDAMKLLTDGAALHWLPFYIQCNPCHPAYNPSTIIKMETWLRDTKVFLEQSGLESNRLREVFIKKYESMNLSKGGGGPTQINSLHFFVWATNLW